MSSKLSHRAATGPRPPLQRECWARLRFFGGAVEYVDGRCTGRGWFSLALECTAQAPVGCRTRIVRRRKMPADLRMEMYLSFGVVSGPAGVMR